MDEKGAGHEQHGKEPCNEPPVPAAPSGAPVESVSPAAGAAGATSEGGASDDGITPTGRSVESVNDSAGIAGVPPSSVTAAVAGASTACATGSGTGCAGGASV